MSKKHPTATEARWRAHRRYLRERTKWLNEEADGDPLGFVASLRRSNTLAALQRAIVATAPCQAAIIELVNHEGQI